MPVIEITSEAYAIVTERAALLQLPPQEVASKMLTSEREQTHPYIECRQDVAGGKAVIKGTRLPVWQLAERLRLGDTAEDLAAAYSHIPLAAIYDAISYSYDHHSEIEQQIAENQIEHVLAQHNAVIDSQGRIQFCDLAAHE
jgi:uncharacterized protein (DUF433 family)